MIAVIERNEMGSSFVTSLSISYITPPMKIRRLEGVGSQHILPRLNITDNKYCITVMQSVHCLTPSKHATYFEYFMIIRNVLYIHPCRNIMYI